jgi:hypothetical protein
MEIDPTGQKLPAWRWWAYLILLFVFPVVFHPWWLAIILMAIFLGLMILLLRIPK